MEMMEQIFRQRRVAFGLTQDQVARASGLSRKTVSDFENGGSRINLANLQRLLRSVGLELAVREASSRPTLEELDSRYGGGEVQKIRRRARRKAAP